jgi:hypothetical protein
MLQAADQFDLIHFRWGRDPGGYRHHTAQNSSNYIAALTSGRPVVPAHKGFPIGTPIIEGRTRRAVAYEPKASDALHWQFAELSDEPEELVTFANKHGLPTIAVGPEAVADLFKMRDRLKAIIGAIGRAAKAKGLYAVKRRLEAAKVYAENGVPLMSAALVHTEYEDGVMALALKAKPVTLFDYMLLLAAFELQGKAEWRRCLFCKKPFAVGQGNYRRDKYTCSEKCKKAKQRQDKEVGHASKG